VANLAVKCLANSNNNRQKPMALENWWCVSVSVSCPGQSKQVTKRPTDRW